MSHNSPFICRTENIFRKKLKKKQSRGYTTLFVGYAREPESFRDSRVLTAWQLLKLLFKVIVQW